MIDDFHRAIVSLCVATGICSIYSCLCLYIYIYIFGKHFEFRVDLTRQRRTGRTKRTKWWWERNSRFDITIRYTQIIYMSCWYVFASGSGWNWFWIDSKNIEDIEQLILPLRIFDAPTIVTFNALFTCHKQFFIHLSQQTNALLLPNIRDIQHAPFTNVQLSHH